MTKILLAASTAKSEAVIKSDRFISLKILKGEKVAKEMTLPSRVFTKEKIEGEWLRE